MASIKIKDLKVKCYPEHKREIDKKVSWWVYYVIRPASFYATYVAYFLGLHPNQATLIGLIVGVISILMAFSGNLFIATLLLNIFAILDCVDGNLARLGHSSKRGEFYDAVSGDLVNYLFPPVFLLSALRDGYLYSLEFIGYENISIIIILIAFIQLLTGLTNQRLKLIVIPPESNSHTGEISSVSLLETLVRNSYGMAFFYPVSFIVSIFGGFDILLVYFALSAPAFYIISIMRVRFYEE